MSKYITTFEFESMNDINDYVNSVQGNKFNYKEIKELLSTENITFVLSGINRLQSTLLCEEGYSYVQQSQRYVPVTDKYIRILDNTPEDLKNIGIALIYKSIILYNKMTELVDNNKKGRPSIKDFVHGISYEDARSILPLAISTNIVVTMSADKLIDLVGLFIKYNLVFNDIARELERIIPFNLYRAIFNAAYHNLESNNSPSDRYFKHKYKDLSLNNPVILLKTTNNVALSALASQNEKSPDVIYNSWGDDTEVNSHKIIKNVLGYHHYGINEHSRNTFAMTCSLATYHQVIRHRLQNIRREPLKNIILENNREFVIPDSIKNSAFIDDVNSLINDYMTFYELYSKEYDHQFIMQFMLNAAAIKFVVSSNIRNDNSIFSDRLCYTAQKEIRDLYLKKFKILHSMYPEMVKYGIPPCVTTGKCKEGKLTCGHMAEVKEEYKDFI